MDISEANSVQDADSAIQQRLILEYRAFREHCLPKGDAPMHAITGKKKLIGLIGMTGLLFSVWFSPARADDTFQIYMWVANEMQADSVPTIPQIHFVEKTELQATFKANNQKSYLRWEAKYGEDQAQDILNRCLEGVVGLFVPQTETIYVGAFLPLCRQQAILAHEMSHFFQHITSGVISPDQANADLEYLFREMQASKIEKEFMETHCKAPQP
jgi:hypothetical protein